MRLRRQQEVADLVVANMVERGLPMRSASRLQAVKMMEADVMERLIAEGWREYA
jgi:hypothetical protein